MKKKGMKRAFVLAVALALMLALTGGGAFTSYADYVANNLEMLSELIEEKRELVEVTLPAELEELENVTIPALEKELEELQEAHEKDLEENPHSIDTWLEVQVKSKESELNERKRDIDRIKEKIESETYSLSELEKRLEQETKSAYDPSYGTSNASSDELRATNFAIANKDGSWFLFGQYRSWNSLMGGSWFYNKGVTDDLEIGFYIDSECVESSLSRAESYDTETAYAWAVPFDLEYSTFYKIEINNIKFNVSTVGKYGLSKGTGTSTGTEKTDNKEDTSTEQETTNTNTTATTDYPGCYDATLADNIPNQSYYAQATDGGWTVSLDGNGVAHSTYDRSNQRDYSDYVKGWLCKDGKWYAFDSEGHQVAGWMSVGGNWYCVYPGADAVTSFMLTGWQEINSNWYYFNTSGQMVANCVVDGYSIGADGVWRQ